MLLAFGKKIYKSQDDMNTRVLPGDFTCNHENSPLQSFVGEIAEDWKFFCECAQANALLEIDCCDIEEGQVGLKRFVLHSGCKKYIRDCNTDHCKYGASTTGKKVESWS
ncbi:hypothetical protein KIN20_022728 [Parelaphostrongylus tenuis]|uniref:Uncharacterized protein n=1 Tax=Parelaphostrongylus tenuis TaxID=148309 RepID=A0AAD5N8A5_PARTN|nr:hypothetical protein KIN20_022728 [Parelaphostrongylus tenuis]